MSGERSGRANRVAPDQSRHAVPDRGLFWGNRGPLLGAAGQPVRHAAGTRWIICLLDFQGRRRTQWQPGRLTELYFLDEPTGLAAGHRPCAECRRDAFERFQAAWSRAHPGRGIRATEIDAVLAVERSRGGDRAELAGLPAGVIVEHEDAFWLVGDDALHRWSFGGYAERRDRAGLPASVVVRTPRSTVATLRAGYAPEVHPSASPR